MSRCYTFPPPGYERNGIRDEALIESIKKEEEKVKKERKEKKREKTEKKRKERESGDNKKHSHKRRHKEKDTNDNHKALSNGKIVEENKLLEKSCLTDERGNQTGSQNSCDSTLNSNGRQPNQHNSSESIFRIRIPVKRQKDPEALTSKDQQQPCTSRERIEAARPAPRTLVDPPCSISTIISPKLVLSQSDKSDDKQRSRIEETIQPSNRCNICPPEVAAFMNLIDNWVPDPVEREHLVDSEDQEWLIRSDRPKIDGERCKGSSLETSGGSSTTKQWPSACFLPEADLYALPYTVPF